MRWDKVKLMSLCDRVISGGTPKSDEASYYTDGTIPWLRTQEVTFNRIYDTDIKINENGLNNSNAKWVKENSVIVAMYGNSAGRTAIAKIPLTTNQACCNLEINPNKADYNFIYYKLLSEFEALKGLSKGAAQNNLNANDVKEFPIALPILPTQRKIANILSAYDDLIENNLKRIKLLEEKAFASYKLIVQNEKLEEFTIEELANVVMGQSPTSDTYTHEKEDNLPFHQGVTNFSNYFVEHKIFCKLPIKIAQEGDILFSVRAPVGRINFTNDKICIGRGLCAFRSKRGFQNYLYHQLKEFFYTEDVIGNGAIFNAVTKVELMKIKLKTPSEKIQQEFEVDAERMYNLILNLTKQNTKLRDARDILLPKLMSGQIEI